jgi:hypothetical protein
MDGYYGGFFTKFPNPPKIVVLEDNFDKDSIPLIASKICKFKDDLMEYVIFIFKYYGFNFTINSTQTIFEKYKNEETGKIDFNSI